MDTYADRYPSRTTPKPKNPLVDLQPMVVPWPSLEAYFSEMRERVIRDMANSETERALWQAQGKLAIIDELTHLRDILQVLDTQGKG